MSLTKSAYFYDKDFYLNLYKDIVRAGDKYELRAVYEEDENGKLRRTSCHKLNPNQNRDSKNCYCCVHCYSDNCTLRARLEYPGQNVIIPFEWIANCDAYSPVSPMKIIRSERDMISFISEVENFFGCPEEYEAYFGFERKWDEGTGDILESTMEYYERGGKFSEIPTNYPVVIYFGVVDFDGGRSRDDKLNWIYIGDPNEQ